MMMWKEQHDRKVAEKNRLLAELPTHKKLGSWIHCCSDPVCHRVQPTEFGCFSYGSGFSHDEARALVFAFRDAENYGNLPQPGPSSAE